MKEKSRTLFHQEENETHIAFIPTSSIKIKKPDHWNMMLKMCNQKFVLHNIEKFFSYCLECLQSITCHYTSLFTSTLREVYIVINFLVKLQNLPFFSSNILNLRSKNRKGYIRSWVHACLRTFWVGIKYYISFLRYLQFTHFLFNVSKSFTSLNIWEQYLHIIAISPEQEHFLKKISVVHFTFLIYQAQESKS